MRALDRTSSAERLHTLGHGGEAKALRRRRIDSLAVVDDGESEDGLRPLRAVTPVSALLDEVDREVVRRAVPDGIGDAFLDAAIEREIDRLAIGFCQPSGRIMDVGIGMAALETSPGSLTLRKSRGAPAESKHAGNRHDEADQQHRADENRQILVSAAIDVEQEIEILGL